MRTHLGIFALCDGVFCAVLRHAFGIVVNGAAVMFGFGLGTLPPVLSAGIGVPWLRRRTRSPLLQKLLGVALIALGILGTIPAATIAGWCRAG